MSTNTTMANATAPEAFSLLTLFSDAIKRQSVEAEAGGLSWNRLGILPVYVISTYGLTTLMVALVLNRTTVIASAARSRMAANPHSGPFSAIRKSPLSQEAILNILRLSAAYVLFKQIHNVLVALCVIGQNFDSGRTSVLSRWLSPKYFQYDPVAYATDRFMAMPANEVRFGPTCDMFWPVFLAVCYSSFVETFASAITEKRPQLEGGITLLELSVSLHEMSSGFFFPRGSNVALRPTEQLLMVCLLSLAEHITGQIGSVLYQNKYRLVPSSIINIFFLWYFVSCVVSGMALRFPFPVLVTYSGLSLTVFSVVVCFGIFALAVITKGANMDELNFMSFFPESHPDREFFSSTLNLSFNMDFYTAALNLGMIAVTSAGKSSYITEYNTIQMPEQTWFERKMWKRLQRAFDFSALEDDNDSLRGKKLLQYLKENRISGYSNMVSTPTRRMVTGTHERMAGNKTTMIKLRYMFTKEILNRVVDLAISYAYWVARSATSRFRGNSASESTPEERLEALKSSAPLFVRHMIKEPEKGSAKYSLADISDDELELEYGTILTQHDLEEADDSPDFEIQVIEESEESDFEDIDTVNLSGRVPVQRDITTALGELLTADGFMELIEEKEVLHHHLRYDYSESGMMTRSRFKACTSRSSGAAADQTQQLAELILSSRQGGRRGSIDSTDSDLEVRFTCVICHCEPREIITWPCKCFAICEGCRVSLAAKGIDGCVCCRRDVEGVSRVFIP